MKVWMDNDRNMTSDSSVKLRFSKVFWAIFSGF